MAYVYWLHLKEHTDYFTQGYIGVSKDPEYRLWQHRYYSNLNEHENPHLQNAFQKYNDQIIQTIILEGPVDYCYEIESKLRPEMDIGWNICSGGRGGPSRKGVKFTEEHRNNLSEALKGHVISEETKRKISDGNKGKKISDKHKEKISKAGKGRKHSNESKQKMSEWQIGKTLSEETKIKISEGNKGKKRSNEFKARRSELTRGENNPNFGKKHSEETREKMRQASRKRWNKVESHVEPVL